MSAQRRHEQRRRAHEAVCESKRSFPSQFVADNFALLVAWAVPDDPRCQGMEGYKCLVCTEWHIGHSRFRDVIPFGHETGRDPRSEADSDASTDTADTLGVRWRRWDPSAADFVQESSGGTGGTARNLG